MLGDVEAAMRLAEQSDAEGDRATARVLIAAARSTLGKIDERFAVPGGENSRALLRETDSDLKAMELADRPSAEMFSAWRGQWAQRSRALRSAEPRSLFSEAVLRRALQH